MSEVTAQHSKLGWWILAGLWALAPESLESWPAAANHAARLHRSGWRAQSYQRSARPQSWVGAVGQEDSATRGYAADATTLRAPSPLLLCLQPATLRLGDSVYTASSPGRSPSYRRAVVPGSVSVGVMYMQPASGLFDVPHIHQRPGATDIEATPAIPVEAVAQNQYHCPGSSCWDVSGCAAVRRLACSWVLALEEVEGWRGGRLKSVRVVR